MRRELQVDHHRALQVDRRTFSRIMWQGNWTAYSTINQRIMLLDLTDRLQLGQACRRLARRQVLPAIAIRPWATLHLIRNMCLHPNNRGKAVHYLHLLDQARLDMLGRPHHLRQMGMVLRLSINNSTRPCITMLSQLPEAIHHSILLIKDMHRRTAIVHALRRECIR